MRYFFRALLQYQNLAEPQQARYSFNIVAVGLPPGDQVEMGQFEMAKRQRGDSKTAPYSSNCENDECVSSLIFTAQ